MKILHVVDSINRAIGGPARSVTRLADTMANDGHEVTVLANDYRELGPSQPLHHARAVLVPARRLPFRFGAWSPGLAAAMQREVTRADWIHIHGIWLRPNHLAAKLARRQGKPYCISPRGMLETWAANHRKFRKQIVWHWEEKRLLSEANFLHATSEAEAANLNTLRIAREIVVAPNGVDLPDSPVGREVVENRFPVLRHLRILLFLSRLHPKKGLDELLNGWSRLAPNHPDWILAVCGDDFDNRQVTYHSRSNELGIPANQILFTGHLEGDEKSAMLGACELFVLPSHSENFGIVIGEALAAGKPVITTRATPWPWIELEGCGWWISPGESALAASLSQALKLTSGELAERGARGPSLIRSRFNWKASSQILLSAYQSALNS